MKKFLLMALMTWLILTLGFIASCDDDDDDDSGGNDDDGDDDDLGQTGDDDDSSSGEGLCYVKCENGCMTVGACLSGVWSDDECRFWGEQQCGEDDCTLANSQFVPGCSLCNDCPDIPDWY